MKICATILLSIPFLACLVLGACPARAQDMDAWDSSLPQGWVDDATAPDEAEATAVDEDETIATDEVFAVDGGKVTLQPTKVRISYEESGLGESVLYERKVYSDTYQSEDISLVKEYLIPKGTTFDGVTYNENYYTYVYEADVDYDTLWNYNFGLFQIDVWVTASDSVGPVTFLTDIDASFLMDSQWEDPDKLYYTDGKFYGQIWGGLTPYYNADSEFWGTYDIDYGKATVFQLEARHPNGDSYKLIFQLNYEKP